MRTVRVKYHARKFYKAGAFLFLLGVLWFPGSVPSFLWASSSRIHIQPESPFFFPNHLTINSGTLLTWENATHEAHSIVSDDCLRLSGCSFDSGIIRPNDHFSLPDLQPGRYPYHCGLHPFMRGLLTIHHPPFRSSDI